MGPAPGPKIPLLFASVIAMASVNHATKCNKVTNTTSGDTISSYDRNMEKYDITGGGGGGGGDYWGSLKRCARKSIGSHKSEKGVRS